MQDLVRLLRDLVALPSVNPMGREIPAHLALEHRVTTYLDDFFHELSVPCEHQLVAPGRENLVARLELGGKRRTVLLEAHQDTVPVDAMTFEPFAGTIE